MEDHGFRQQLYQNRPAPYRNILRRRLHGSHKAVYKLELFTKEPRLRLHYHTRQRMLGHTRDVLV